MLAAAGGSTAPASAGRGPAGPTLPAAGPYALDAPHTFIYFAARQEIAGMVRGRFDKMSAEETVVKDAKKIAIAENGPYVVSGGVPLNKQTVGVNAGGESVRWIPGEAIAATPDPYYLCRCGRSKTKPFCDGTHKDGRFDGTETASREPYAQRAQVLDGPTMQLGDDERCAFARFCDPHGQVWSQVERTDDPSVRAHFVLQVGECPAGRLVAWDKSTQKEIEPKFTQSIGLVEDPAQGCSGPLWVRGGIPITAADGHTYEVRNRAALCRCGESKNKPFCDGTHAAIKFNDGL